MRTLLDIMFHEISMEDQEIYFEYVRHFRLTACDYTFSNMICWKDKYHTQIATIKDCLIAKYEVDGQVWFAYPMHVSVQKRIDCVRFLLRLCQAKGIALQFTLITIAFKKELEEQFPGIFEIFSFRDGFDYVYSREKLATLAGRKMAPKRNHVRRFEDGGPWTFEFLEKETIEECWQLELRWCSMQEDPAADDLEYEKKSIRFALDHFSELGLEGGLIRKNGEVVAFSVGEKLNPDTFVVHFEKARGDLQGAFQVINQQMALHFDGYEFFNREDDAGKEGLRRAKLSYDPEMMVEKYMAVGSGLGDAPLL